MKCSVNTMNPSPPVVRGADKPPARRKEIKRAGEFNSCLGSSLHRFSNEGDTRGLTRPLRKGLVQGEHGCFPSAGGKSQSLC